MRQRIMTQKFDLDLVESIEPQIFGRYVVIRKNAFFGSKTQIMTLKEESLVIADFPDLENSRETFTLDENIRIVPDHCKFFFDDFEDLFGFLLDTNGDLDQRGYF